jgi:pSer/pThr/pTyr-binding forkhead associated (FHA) protein
MKVSLVVAQGVHNGKVIPVGAAQFLIGRDPHCNLRPASPAISKQHCGILVRDGKVFVVDYGSTNGTSVNGEPVAGEREVADGDQLKAGPLEFVIKVEVTATVPAPAVVAAVGTTNPVAAAETSPGTSTAEDDESAAALLLMDETGALDPTAEAKIPDGTTVMDAPAVPGAAAEKGKTAPAKSGDSSKAAADILSKYMRRPRT